MNSKTITPVAMDIDYGYLYDGNGKQIQHNQLINDVIEFYGMKEEQEKCGKTGHTTEVWCGEQECNMIKLSYCDKCGAKL